MIDIVKTQPTEIIEILNADINVDFDIALDYEEAEEPIEELKDEQEDKIENYKITHDLKRFPGKGNRLGST
jgi:hypothetical protein